MSSAPAQIAAAVIVLLVLTALLAPLSRPMTRWPWTSTASDSRRARRIFSARTAGEGHPFAHDLRGAHFPYAVGIAASFLSLCIGIFFGLIAGYFGGKTDTVLSQFFDVFLAFPSLLLAIGISAVMPPGLTSAMLAITLVGWAGFARLVRGITLSLKEQTYVEASRAIGASSARTLYRHYPPECTAAHHRSRQLARGGFILLEAALSFLGLGVQPPTPTWGSMISLNRAYINSAPWMVIFPGLAISVTVIAFNLLGDFLRDKLDPRFQG